MEEGLFEDGLYYRLKRSQNSGPTLLFIHGLSGSSSVWLPYENIFEGDYTMLSVDLRGHGKSRKPLTYQAYAIEKNATDIGRLITRLQLRDIVVVSHSLGTLVALELLRITDSIIGSVFISTNFKIHQGPRALVVIPLASLWSEIMTLLPFKAWVGKELDYARYKNTGDWNIRRISADVPNTGFHPYFYSLAQTYAYSRHANWSTIHVPTLIMHGAHDTLVPIASVEKMPAQIPSAKLIVIPEADHMIMLNSVPEVSKHIKRFLNELPKRP